MEKEELKAKLAEIDAQIKELNKDIEFAEAIESLNPLKIGS